MFWNLGENFVICYFRDEYVEISELMQSDGSANKLRPAMSWASIMRGWIDHRLAAAVIEDVG